MGSACPNVLGLFPGIEAYGGVQASGRVAWEGILDAAAWQSHSCAAPTGYLLCYGADRRSSHAHDWLGAHTSSRSGAIGAVLRAPRSELVLIWHLSLLKLLPVLLAGQRTRIVLFLHGIEAWRRQSWLNRLLLRRVDLFLTNSSYTWDRFTRANPAFARSCQAVVELGLGRQLPMPSPRPGSPPVALMVGRLLRSEDYKGHRQVIDAWPQVVRAIPDAELWIVGDGDLRPELEQLVSMRRLERSVRFWGFISDHEKEALLTHSRCLVLPSTGEGFGLVYLEAMRLGRPCLVSAQDAGREVVNPPEAGLAVDPNQTRELAEAVRTLLTPGAAWDEWSAAAQARYANRFTARHFQARLLRALTPFLPASRPSAG